MNAKFSPIQNDTRITRVADLVSIRFEREVLSNKVKITNIEVCDMVSIRFEREVLSNLYENQPFHYTNVSIRFEREVLSNSYGSSGLEVILVSIRFEREVLSNSNRICLVTGQVLFQSALNAKFSPMAVFATPVSPIV